MFFVLYLIAFIYCANLGVNATFLLVYLSLIPQHYYKYNFLST